MAKVSTTCLDNLSRGELKEIAKFLTDSLTKDPLTRWMLCNDEEAIKEKFPKMVLMDLSVKGDERKSIFVSRMYGGMGEGRRSHELVAVGVWRKTMEHMNEPEKEEEAEAVEEKEKVENEKDKKGSKKKDEKGKKGNEKNRKAAERKKEREKEAAAQAAAAAKEKEKEKAKLITGEEGKTGKDMLLYERNQLIVEKFHKVKFDIFPIMKYDKPIVYVSWIGTIDPFDQFSDKIIKEIFTKSKAQEEELICMLGSNDRNEQFYQSQGFKTIGHVFLTDHDIENVDVIYDSIGADTKMLVEHQQVEIFTMIKEPELPDIPFLVPR